MKKIFRQIYEVLLGNFISKVSYKLYIKNKERYLSEKASFRKDLLDKSVSVSEGATITNKSIISNNRNDKSKISVGKHSNISGHLLVFKHSGEISIGDFCYIGENSKVWSADKIIIGNRVLIANNVNIHDNNSHSLDPELRHNDFLNSFYNTDKQGSDLNAKAVIINDDVWIGFNATVMKGVTIGEGAVVAACSVVLKDVLPFTMVAGIPAKEIKKLNISRNV